MSNWRYFAVSGSPTAFYIPIIESTNLKELEESFYDWMVDMVWADPTALPPWAPGSRHDKATGFNGSFIDSNFFHVRIHRYKKGATEIDLSSASVVRVYLFSFDESRQYGEQWQAIRLNNPVSWMQSDETAMFNSARTQWDWFWKTQTAHTKLNDEFLRNYVTKKHRGHQMDLWEQSLLIPDEASYGGTV